MMRQLTMGEMADECLEISIFSELEYEGEEDFPHNPFYCSGSTKKHCKYCGKRGLSWESTDQGWRLREGEKAHVCQEYLEIKGLAK